MRTMTDTYKKPVITEEEEWGQYLCWKELRPFKYCLIKPRNGRDDKPPTERMDKILKHVLLGAAFRCEIKKGFPQQQAFLHQLFNFFSKDSFYLARLYTPSEVLINLDKIYKNIPDLLKGARPSYAEICKALGIPDTYTHG